MIFKLFLFKIV